MTQILYLLHFETPMSHAQHYLGSTDNVRRRIKRHRDQQGARITSVATERNIQLIVAGLFQPKDPSDNIRKIEANAKLLKNGRRYCPICNPNAVAPPGTISIPIPKELNSHE